MGVEYTSRDVLEHAEELMEIGRHYNPSAAAFLKDYARLLAKNEHECYACHGSGSLEMGNREPWACHTCHGSGKTHYDPCARLIALRNMWEQDAREYLNTYGQHMPASLECLIEQLDAAMKPLQVHQLRGKYRGCFSSVQEFIEDRKAEDGE